MIKIALKMAKLCSKLSGRGRKDLELPTNEFEKNADRIYAEIAFICMM